MRWVSSLGLARLSTFGRVWGIEASLVVQDLVLVWLE